MTKRMALTSSRVRLNVGRASARPAMRPALIELWPRRRPAQPHALAAPERPRARDIGGRDQQHAAVVGGDAIERAVALVGDVDDLAGDGVRGVRPRRAEGDLLRPQRQPAAAVADGQDVGDADEVGDEARARPLVDFVRRADLHDAAEIHDGQPARHRHRLLLVVRHHDEGEAELLLQAHQLEARALAQLAVERGQRLVEQQELGPLDQRAGQRHALALAARELRRPPRGIVRQPHLFQHRGDARRRSPALGRPSRRSP